MSESDSQILPRGDAAHSSGQAHPRQAFNRISTEDYPNFYSDTLDPLAFATVPEAQNDRTTLGLGISAKWIGDNRTPKRVTVGNGVSRSPSTPSPPTFTPAANSGDSPMQQAFAQIISSENSPGLQQALGSSKPLLSPRFPSFEASISTNVGLDTMREEEDISRGRPMRFDDGDNERVAMNYDNVNSGLIHGCASHKDLLPSKVSWINISILLLSVFSTIFSGIWFILAIVQPRYGRAIHSGGKLTPSTASTLFALVAKAIELSFVAVFVTFLGQALTRRSLSKASRGVTIAELSMRQWILQPGFMITHWQHLQHAALSLLGLITLTAAFMAMFYTTASDSLVSPHLMYGQPEKKLLWGLVKTSYANTDYIQAQCQTPISRDLDKDAAGTTCLAIEHAGMAYHNSLAYLTAWQKISVGPPTGASSDLALRPRPLGNLYDNTTVTGSWVETENSDVNAAFAKHDRIINNITMAMPHAGVFAAAHDPRNGILQPEDLAGVGEYNLRASVVSPVVNILCVNMNSTELEPLIYVGWPDASYNLSSDGTGQKLPWLGWENDVTDAFATSPFLNRTVVDDIFEWGSNYGVGGRFPPVFAMLPIDFNSLTNITVARSDSNYLLIKSAATTDYTMCQMRSWLSPNCSTQYNVSGMAGGHLESHCEDPNDAMAYIHSVVDAPFPTIGNGDYRNVASMLLLSLAMNTGISNANASSTRLLSQLILTEKDQPKALSPLKPSIAEVLAVMAGGTLLLGSTDSSYFHFWNYTNNTINPGAYQAFNASLASQQYASGIVANWQGIFYIVLFLVFATNVCCLVYFIWRYGIVTDYTEPQNLFALAVNSPPSQRLNGSCGAGPRGYHLDVDWHVQHEPGSNHFFIRDGEVEPYDMELRQRRNTPNTVHSSMSSYVELSEMRARNWL